MIKGRKTEKAIADDRWLMIFYWAKQASYLHQTKSVYSQFKSLFKKIKVLSMIEEEGDSDIEHRHNPKGRSRR